MSDDEGFANTTAFGAGDALPSHPALAKLSASGVDPSEIVRLDGIVGTPPATGVVRLYPRMTDLTVSVDIPASHVLHVGYLDGDRAIIWIRRDAEVTFIRTVQLAAAAVRQLLGEDMSRASAKPAESPSDRLNIRMAETAGPVGVCHSYCAVCQSNCLGICTSGPQ
jgi:hypothetical protein